MSEFTDYSYLTPEELEEEIKKEEAKCKKLTEWPAEEYRQKDSLDVYKDYSEFTEEELDKMIEAEARRCETLTADKLVDEE